MATLEELCQQYGVNLEKTAEEKVMPEAKEEAKKADVVAQLKEKVEKESKEEPKKENNNEDMKKEGGFNMSSLRDVYEAIMNQDDQEKVAQVQDNQLTEEDLEKIAQDELEEMEKQAEDLRTAGRFMAHGFMDELNKIAEAVAEAPVHEGESREIPQQLPTNFAGKEKLDTTGAEVQTQNDVKDVLVEKAVQDLLMKKKGLNPSGQTGQDNKIAPDANQA